MTVEIFKTEREFIEKFKSGIYKCCYCNQLTSNPYICIHCGNQANKLISTDTYKYMILNEHKEIQQIFQPIERISVERSDIKFDKTKKGK